MADQFSLPRAAANGSAAFFGTVWIAGVLLGGGRLTRWFFDFRPLPDALACATVLTVGTLLLAWSLGLLQNRPRWQRATAAGLTVLAALAIANSAAFYALIAQGRISPGIPVPLSLILAIGLAVGAWRVTRSETGRWGRRSATVAIGTAGMWAILVPLAFMVLFGRTDYRRPADAAVVLGARTYANGKPSDALRDRVATACELYRDGLVQAVVMSGGPGDGAIHETQAMRDLAISLGVQPQHIHLDPHGLNTTATANNVTALSREHHWTRLLIVSHAYHLPRTKVAFASPDLHAFTVPAKETYLLTKMPWLMAREVAAWWVYWGRS